MRYRVELSEEAREQLLRLAPVPRRRVRQALKELAADPYGPGSLRLDSRQENWRVQVGRLRILFRPGESPELVSVFRIALRTVAYDDIERRRR